MNITNIRFAPPVYRTPVGVASGCGQRPSSRPTSAADGVSVIDPRPTKSWEKSAASKSATVRPPPDGSRYYISNEATAHWISWMPDLNVPSAFPLPVIPTTSRSARRPSRLCKASPPRRAVVIDTTSGARQAFREGSVHNTYVTPDGKFVVSGSVQSNHHSYRSEDRGRMVSGNGPRHSPMAFAAIPMEAPSGFRPALALNGFAVVISQPARKSRRIKLLPCPLARLPSWWAATNRMAWRSPPMARPW
jgi:hypothetical protein